MQYDVIVVYDAEQELVRRVNSAIAQGWEPLGGPCFLTYINGLGQQSIACYQAMIAQPSSVKRQEST